MSNSQTSSDNSAATKLLNWIIEAGMNGVGFLPPAEEVAQHYLSESNYDQEKAIDSLIAWKTAHGAGTGFVTGLGGLITLPVAVPASLATSYAIGANTAAAIAYIRGYDIQSDQVRTFILLSLIGEAGVEVLRQAGILAGTKVAQVLVRKIPGKVLIEINKKVGFRLITKAGEKGVVNLMKIVPIVGGVIGAGFDSTFINTCGKTAKKLFEPIS